MAWCCGEQSSQAQWGGSLTLPERHSLGASDTIIWSSAYLDPNAIEIFWIGSLIRAKRQYLTEKDFVPLLTMDGA